MSLVIASESPVNRELVRVPGPAKLRFGFGAPRGDTSPIELSLHARAGSKAFETIFSRRIGESERDGWHDVEVDLPDHALPQVELEFRVKGPTGTPSFAFVSSPLLATPGTASRAPDVILISLDTLRADRLSAYGYSLPTTPNLDRFARDHAARFATVVTQAPTTHPSHTSLFTGLDAFRHNANRDAASSDLVLLAEIFRDAGYETAAFTGGAMMHPRHGLTQGFETFRYWLDTERRDDEIDTGLSQLLHWLRSPRHTPRFLFWHTYEIHSPYRKREPHFSRLHSELVAPAGQVQVGFSQPRLENGYLAPGPAEFLLHESAVSGSRRDGLKVSATLASALYDGAIAYADDRVGRLLDELERTGQLNRTIVAIVSDHGESFGEHGLGFHGHLYDDNLLVPLFLSIPGKRYGGRVITEQVRMMDVMPTLLEAAGLPVPEGLDSISLLPLLGDHSSEHRDAWSYSAGPNRGIALRRNNGLKYIFNNTAWRVLSGKEEIYDLRADPGELKRLELDSSVVRGLQAEVGRVLEQRASGWRLVLSNGDSGRLRGRISGSWIHGARVRTLGPEAEPLDPLEDPAAMRFDVPARSTSTWLLDGAPQGDLALSLDLRGAPRIKISPFEGEGPRSWILSAGEFRFVEGRLPLSSEVGFGLHFLGIGSSARGIPTPAASEEMRQLVALGYLN